MTSKTGKPRTFFYSVCLHFIWLHAHSPDSLQKQDVSSKQREERLRKWQEGAVITEEGASVKKTTENRRETHPTNFYIN